MTRTRKAQADPWALAAKQLDPIAFMETVVGEHFQPPDDWARWKVFIRDVFALPMGVGDVETYRRFTGRATPPTAPATEAHAIVGRRGGKGRIAALLACWAATAVDYRPILGPGEHGVVSVSAQSKAKSSDLRKSILALIEGSPLLRGLLDGDPTDEAILLRNRTRIEVQAASFRLVRGGDSCVMALLDEVAAWYSAAESMNPDSEVVAALRPTLYTARAAGLGGLMLFTSSPLGKKGVLWNAYRDHFGRDGDKIRVWQGSTSDFHPRLTVDLLADEISADPAAARAEIFGLFRDDIIAFMTEDLLAGAVRTGWTGEGPRDGVHYWGFVDPAGGSGGDSSVLGISRREGRRSVIVRLDEYRPPFSAVDSVAEMAATCKEYGVRFVMGDGFSGGTHADLFKRHGIVYHRTKKTKSEIFHDALPLFTGGLAVLPDHKRMAAQFLALERTTTRGSNRETIGSPRGGWDDLANAAAGALLVAQRRPMFEGEGERERARRAGPGPALDQHGAYEETRVVNGVRLVFRVFQDGRVVPDRVAEGDEVLVHSFQACGVCGHSHIVIGGEAAPCPRAEPWTPTQLARQAVPLAARPDIEMVRECGDLGRLARTIGWKG